MSNINKIVELKAEIDNLEFEDVGVEIMSLVDEPAIGIYWAAFAAQHLFVSKIPGESESDYMGRCMPVVIAEGYEADQAAAICYAGFQNLDAKDKFYVDNKGMKKFKTFLDENKDIMKKPGGHAAGEGGVDHGAQIELLEEAGIDTEYPFGYCFQIAQFLFYALGGYKSKYDLKCIKGMEYQVKGVDFQSTHWYVQSKEDGRIIDLSAEQFDEILDIEDYYEDGRRANLGFPYYNVGEERVEFEDTVPSLMTLKLYSVWREQYGELEGIEEFYQACQYEEYRMSMQFSEAELPYTEFNIATNKFEVGIPHYTEDGVLYEGPTHKHNDRLMTGATHTENSQYLYHTPNYLQDKEMVDGIIDLLLKVKDPVNRRQMAQDVLNGFDTDKVIYDLDDFVTRIGFGLEDACWPGWEAIGLKPKGGRMVPNCVPMNNEKVFKSFEQFESYSDYPESAKNAAQRALDYRDANPDTDCGTPVGWARANQLAKGENISEETIARMASFARHLQYKDVPYTEGCGGLMVDAWGGQAGIEWASNKLEEIRSEDFSINIDGLPNYIDETDGLKPKELDAYQTAILNKASERGFGEVLDIEMTDYVNLSKDKFETISDFLRANNSIDVLDEIVNSGAEQMVLPSYRYTGPIRANSRAFCIAMIALGKIYTKVEIDALSQIPFQPGMGPRGANTYSIFDYKGGVNCQHFFEQLRVFKSPGGRNIVISEGPARGDAGEIAKPSNNYWRLSANKSEWRFAEDDDKMIVTGPAMKAFQLIPRRDEDGNLFHVYFSDETIKKLSEKFLKDNNQHTTDINHSMKPNEENTLVESWIVEDPEMDKSRVLGFNPGKGDWYVSYKINNKETWKQIKEGSLNGFSIAGQFIERQIAKL